MHRHLTGWNEHDTARLFHIIPNGRRGKVQKCYPCKRDTDMSDHKVESLRVLNCSYLPLPLLLDTFSCNVNCQNLLERLKLLSHQKNQAPVFIIKVGLEGYFPKIYCKVVKKYCLIFPFAEYPRSLLTTSKLHYTVSSFKVSSSGHQPQDTASDSGLMCFPKQLLLLKPMSK